jgi:hypothetical protein
LKVILSPDGSVADRPKTSTYIPMQPRGSSLGNSSKCPASEIDRLAMFER